MENAADVGDTGFPIRVLDSMTRFPLQSVIRAARVELQQHPVDAMLICGDLTTRGNLAAYGTCVDYLSKAFSLNTWSPEHIHVVPGNHDVDRGAIDHSSDDLTAKFNDLAETWRSPHLPPLTVDAVRSTSVSSHGNRLALYSLNSSLGCGERRHFPEAISRDLAALIDAYISREGLTSAFSLIGETLDTPGFRQSDIEYLCEAIESLNDRTVPLVLSHHNILPQAILRIRLYTEVMNAGLVRSRLTRLPQSVIYCHGHIHDDPIEIISSPDQPHSNMVCISAPQLSQGFNIIEITFGFRGYPIGCTVFRYRLSSRDGCVVKDEKRITLRHLTYPQARVVGHPRIPQVLSTLPDSDQYFLDALSVMQAADPSFDDALLASVLLEAQWLNLAEIIDMHEPPEFWRVRKTVR